MPSILWAVSTKCDRCGKTGIFAAPGVDSPEDFYPSPPEGWIINGGLGGLIFGGVEFRDRQNFNFRTFCEVCSMLPLVELLRWLAARGDEDAGADRS